MPVTLPTYVTKPAATRRTVRTIDLDSTGVWTSGRTEADSQIAREADEAARRRARERDARRPTAAPSAPEPDLIRSAPGPGANVSPRLGLWRSW